MKNIIFECMRERPGYFNFFLGVCSGTGRIFYLVFCGALEVFGRQSFFFRGYIGFLRTCLSVILGNVRQVFRFDWRYFLHLEDGCQMAFFSFVLGVLGLSLLCVFLDDRWFLEGFFGSLVCSVF